MSSWDLDAQNAFGTPGAIAFPGVDGYSRNLWDTTYDNFGPRVGAAYQLNDQHRDPRRLRHHLSAEQHRLLLGPDRLRLRELLGRRRAAAVRHDARAACRSAASPIRCRSRRRSAAIPTRRRSTASARRASIAHFKNGRVACSGTCSSSARSATRWMVSIGYSASVSRNLLNRSFPIQNLQSIDQAMLDALARRSTSPATARSIRRRSRCRIRTSRRRAAAAVRRAAGGATIARQNTLFPYPLLVGSNAAINLSGATADYHSMHAARQPPLRRRPDVRRELHVVARTSTTPTPVEDNQGFNAGGNARGNYSLLDPEAESAPRLQRHAAPLRRRRSSTSCRSAKASRSARQRPCCARSRGGWQLGGSVIWQSGFPIGISGASTGAALARPDRVDGVDFELPRGPAGLVRRPHHGDAAERPPHHAAGEHVPEVQPRRVRRPRRHDAERPHRRRPVLVRQRATDLRRDPHRSAVQHRPEHPPQRSASRRTMSAGGRRRRDERAEPHAVQRRATRRATWARRS